ncbi:hypothetical protein [Rhodococcus xishaensis]|uniref:Uncharacterized protein n=1 Tax=Rhodococcus xishaensis TaxID=2487364 RepID=A0A3S3A3K5_9NOCA|nr:hypothetical protein [Rhodococcus xishaensis]RVW01318.1 hypothetical protein EGT50_13970 [Rhodococcus xishaensis]
MNATVTKLPQPEAFWLARDALAHVLEYSRSRRAGPWSVLIVVLARLIAALEPNIMLPPKPGAAVSLNFFAALVGPSGAGKGVSMGTARDSVRIVDHNGRPIDIDEFPLGSGEGISRTYRPAGTDDNEPNPRTRALFDAPEVDTLAALGARQGATLMPELRKLFIGEQLGFNNGTKATRSILSAHSYRASLTIGVQPMKAGPLLHDADGGTPQRFVFMPVHDPDAPDAAPQTPQPWTVKLPRFGSGTAHLEVPDEARAAMDAHRLATLRGEQVDPLDGHRMLTRLKVAAALMVLDGRSVIDAEDWHLAGTIMRVSDRTRTGIEATLAERVREANRARAQADGERAAIVEDHKYEGDVRRAREGVLRYLTRRGRTPIRELAKSLRSDVRPHLELVLSDLIESGMIREIAIEERRFYELDKVA